MSNVDIYVLPISSVMELPNSYCQKHFPIRFERSQKYRFVSDRYRCIGAGWLLTEILGINEDAIVIGETGKPYAPGQKEFNLSHSGDYVVLAVSSNPVGVDIEFISPKHLDIADKVCTPSELQWIKSDTEKRFYALWTLKEAISKATGKGLSIGLGKIDVLPLVKGDVVTFESSQFQGETFLIYNEEYALSVISSNDSNPLKTVIHYLP